LELLSTEVIDLSNTYFMTGDECTQGIFCETLNFNFDLPISTPEMWLVGVSLIFRPLWGVH